MKSFLPLPCREARTKLSKRPWRVDQFDGFANAWLGGRGDNGSPSAEQHNEGRSPFRRIIMFVDNAGEFSLPPHTQLMCFPNPHCQQSFGTLKPSCDEN